MSLLAFDATRRPSAAARQRPLLVWLVFLLRPAGSTLILMHQSHEGSHATCESFMEFCVEKVECRELYEANPQFGGTGPDFEGIHDNDVGLIRISGADRGLLKSGVLADDFVVVLVRTDLLRWGVSEYFKVVTQNHLDETMGKMDHPDYAPYVDPQFHAGVELAALDLDVELFHAVLDRLVRMWTAKVVNMEDLKKNHKRFGIATYEQFLEGGPTYVRRILDHANITAPCTGAAYTHEVVRAHSDRISDSVTNFDAIYQAFLYADYPTWGGIATQFRDYHI
eukprot:CAMPEP_0118902886 /NCGR_PEP_ID=MMETSP1166-20130328/7974_1 /TAXON_ID=1104430 /ORGANISM="Chrysoreinhardia sp, Strain CCMP3193" /LENGTH=280 /DNA_ID=CAMNT_0006842101 /DNA_START=4 /DNA_END=846 /DNA_ORIENTATION=+